MNLFGGGKLNNGPVTIGCGQRELGQIWRRLGTRIGK